MDWEGGRGRAVGDARWPKSAGLGSNWKEDGVNWREEEEEVAAEGCCN